MVVVAQLRQTRSGVSGLVVVEGPKSTVHTARRSATAGCMEAESSKLTECSLALCPHFLISALPLLLLRCLHLSCRRWPLRAVVLVNSAPQLGQDAFEAWPDFSRWCRSRLLKVENCRPLHPCSQQRGLGRLWTTLTWPASTPFIPEGITAGIWYIMLESGGIDMEAGDDRAL